MRPAVVAMPGNEALAQQLCTALAAERIPATIRHFPDGESHVRIEGDVARRKVIVACTLDRPDPKLVPLLLLACALRESGSATVGLVAPYLAYMRQDRRFHTGETISAEHFAGWISRHFDWLVTVDPHLHRIASLAHVFSIPTRIAHAAEEVATWTRGNVRQPLLIGPDEESSQWVGEVARACGAPVVVLAKERHGDRDVTVSVPNVERWHDHTPVLLDDIVSTARTMTETLGHLRRAGLAAPVCVAVHAVFAKSAFEALQAAGALQVVSCDTIVHPSNRISLAAPVSACVRDLLD